MRCNLTSCNARFGIINVQIRYGDLYHLWRPRRVSDGFLIRFVGGSGERPPREETRLGIKRNRDSDDREKSIYGLGSSLKDSVKELPPVVVETDNKRRTDKDREEVNWGSKDVWVQVSWLRLKVEV